jgi:hypothetical protein
MPPLPVAPPVLAVPDFPKFMLPAVELPEPLEPEVPGLKPLPSNPMLPDLDVPAPVPPPLCASLLRSPWAEPVDSPLLVPPLVEPPVALPPPLLPVTPVLPVAPVLWAMARVAALAISAAMLNRANESVVMRVFLGKYWRPTCLPDKTSAGATAP